MTVICIRLQAAVVSRFGCNRHLLQYCQSQQPGQRRRQVAARSVSLLSESSRRSRRLKEGPSIRPGRAGEPVADQGAAGECGRGPAGGGADQGARVPRVFVADSRRRPRSVRSGDAGRAPQTQATCVVVASQVSNPVMRSFDGLITLGNCCEFSYRFQWFLVSSMDYGLK